MDTNKRDDQDLRQQSEESKKEQTTLNLDTGKEERLDPDDEPTMDFAPGSDGGSAADGGAA